MRNFARCLSLLLLPAILLVGCAVGGSVAPFETQGKFWPEPPELRRIAFVGQFSTSSDLALRESVWSRLVRFTAGASSNEMVRPMAVAATDDQKVIFVADPDAHCVHRYDMNKGRYDCLTSARNLPAIYPVGLALTNNGRLFVSDSQQGMLFQAGPDDKRLEVFSVSSSLKQPTGIFWDEATQRLYVTDTGKQSVLVFDRDGELQATISGRGSDPGKFNFPTYLWVDGNNELLVADSLNFRVQRFDADGNLLHLFGKGGDQPGDFSRPKGVATDSFGHVYVVDALMHSLQIFGRQGELLLSIGGQGQDVGQFWLPNGIFITSDNTIFIADSYNKRVQVFRYVGPES